MVRGMPAAASSGTEGLRLLYARTVRHTATAHGHGAHHRSHISPIIIMRHDTRHIRHWHRLSALWVMAWLMGLSCH